MLSSFLASLLILGDAVAAAAATAVFPDHLQQPIVLPESQRHLEPIEITSIPLPPVVSSLEPGSCSDAVNARGTGCIGQSTGLQAGNFLPDGNHVLATLKFAGAPAAPDPKSVYDGQQLVVLKADGTVFANGDSWKCVTCGVEADRNAIGLSEIEYPYPQAFPDGKRAIAGAAVVDCGEALLASEECGPERVSIYPIRLEDTDDGSGSSASIREVRLHPDGVHIGFNIFDFGDGRLGQIAYTGRLQFNAAPTTGSVMGARYDLVHVNQLYDPDASQPLSTRGDEMVFNPDAVAIGELRGFSGTGQEILYLGFPHESCNIDVFAVHVVTGKVRRLTSHPGYVDPVQMSPDDQSIVIMDTRSNDRTTFMAGLRGVPPIIDLITTTACSSVRNNGQRRFFQPYLLEKDGDHDGYYGQEINSASTGVPGDGSVSDPEWNGRADPWFSPDGARIVYWQAKTVPPACGGSNPLPCYNSTEPGGRTERVMLAHLTSRRPIKPQPIQPLPDIIPWAKPYVPSTLNPARKYPKEGTYTFKGRDSGHANITLHENESKTHLRTVEVAFHAFSDDGRSFLDGTQSVTEDIEHITLDKLEWYANLTWSGDYSGVQLTTEDGFRLSIDVMRNVFEANGTLKTVLDGVEYRQPGNGQ